MAVTNRGEKLQIVASRMPRIREPHVAPLNNLADRIADHERIPRGHVPYVDPAQGGIHARALVLLDNPSTQAEAGTGTGMLSLDNPDYTALNCRNKYAEVGVDWRYVVHWNVCPFPTANPRNSKSTTAERRRAVVWTREFVALCPDLRVVLPLGRAAEHGAKIANLAGTGLTVIEDVPHCGQRGLNSKPDTRELFDTAIRTMQRIVTA